MDYKPLLLFILSLKLSQIEPIGSPSCKFCSFLSQPRSQPFLQGALVTLRLWEMTFWVQDLVADVPTATKVSWLLYFLRWSSQGMYMFHTCPYVFIHSSICVSIDVKNQARTSHPQSTPLRAMLVEPSSLSRSSNSHMKQHRTTAWQEEALVCSLSDVLLCVLTHNITLLILNPFP